jgi:eukaryotic-like serine/threonine-protein kinase
MALTVGTLLGSHEITALLGKGGMGEVYQARDLKLKREVAIKILPEEFSRDPDRVGRFQREAEVLASLNHPNIASIHSLEEAGGSRFLVLELVEGETLADRLRRGPLPAEEALAIARNICEALEAAHEKGIIHRDLKPANVKITPDGKVKVLDFGLAKAMDPGAGRAQAEALTYSPTLSIAGTQAGVILGTAGYMSPEQAKGFATDQRSDIFSFGAVLYEMLTGRQAFQGDNVSEVLASVLAREPDLGLMPPNLNPRLQELLRRALEKNPKRRWHAAGDMRVEMEAVLADPRGVVVREDKSAAAPGPWWKRAIPVALAVILTAAITGAAARWYFRPPTSANITRFQFALAEGQNFSAQSRTELAISRDGTQIVYEANRQLYQRLMSELEARPVSGSLVTTGLVNPVFSPDGRSVAFWSASEAAVKKIQVGGGATVTLCPAAVVFGMTWGEDGIVFAEQGKGILRVSENGGTPEVLVSLKGPELAQGPQVLPGGEAVLFALAPAPDQWDKAKVVVQLLKTQERKTVIEGGSDARYLPTGHIVYAFGGTLFAIGFDLRKLARIGGQVPLLEGIRRGTSGAAQFSFSETGSLVYVPGPASAAAQRALVLSDRKGNVELLKVPPGPYVTPRVSPDGKRIAYAMDDGKDSNIWIYELSGITSPRQLTLGGANRFPVWSADGERVAFQSDREGDLAIFWQLANGSGTAERLTKPEQGVAHIPDSWSPTDKQRFSFTVVKGSNSSVWTRSLAEKEPAVYAESPSARVGLSAFSPDGKSIAYQSNETGGAQLNVFVAPFPKTGARQPITKDGAIHPFWSRDGNELFFATRAQTVAVNIKTQPSVSFGIPVPLQIRPVVNSVSNPRNVDFTPDGKFIIVADAAQPGTLASPQIQVVLNWFEDVKQRMAKH